MIRGEVTQGLLPEDDGRGCRLSQSCGCRAAAPALSASYDMDQTRAQGGNFYHPRIKVSVLRLAKRPRELDAHEHNIAAMAQDIARGHAQCAVPAVRVADEHNTHATRPLGRNRRVILMMCEDALRGVGDESARRVSGARRVHLRLPQLPKPISHYGGLWRGGRVSRSCRDGCPPDYRARRGDLEP